MSSSSGLIIAASAVLAYLIGGFPFGYLFVRFSSGKDIRTMGSGNIGATNVQRTSGLKAGIVVLLLDILKGFGAVWLAAILTHGDPMGLGLAAAGVMMGHCYPIFLGFKGGKAVACFIGAFLYLAPLALAFTAVIFVIVAAWSRHISLASIIGVIAFPLVAWLASRPDPAIMAASVFAAVLIVYRHRANISRLRSGTEHVFSLKGPSKGANK